MVDIVEIRKEIKSGRLKATVDYDGNIYLEDTLSSEIVLIGIVPPETVTVLYENPFLNPQAAMARSNRLALSLLAQDNAQKGRK